MANDLPRITSTGTFNTGQSKAPGAPSVTHKEEKPPRELPHIDSQHLVDTFITAAQIWSPSGHEKEMAEKMKADFEALHIPGSTVEFDDSASRTGSDTGNVIVGIPASDHAPKDAKSIALSFHLDRVPVRMPGVPEDEPVHIEQTSDGIIRSKDSRTNIAADDRTGYAAILEAVRTLTLSGFPHGRIKVIGFVGEEPGLFGARQIDSRHLKDLDYGFEMDGGTVGNVIHGAAGIHRFRAVIKGESAPSIKQAQGKSALLAGADMAMKASSMPLEKGQLVNISNITAGVQDKDGRPLFNVVPDSAEVDVEVRGRTTEEADALRKNVYAVFEETAKAHGVTIDMTCDTMVGFQLANNAPVVAFAEAATRAAGFKPRTITMMGGSDANYMNDKGLPTVIIGSGAFNQHTEREYTTRNALVSTTRVVMSLIATAANPAIAAAFATAGQTPPGKAPQG